MEASSRVVRSRVKLLRVLAVALALSSAAAGVAQASDSSDGEAGDDRSLSLLPMPEIEVPIVEAGAIRGTLRMQVVLEATDQQAGWAITDDMPLLRSASVTAASEFARLHASAFRAVDARELRAALTDALRARSDKIARVLIVEVAAANA